jgi:hypothetical protein
VELAGLVRTDLDVAVPAPGALTAKAVDFDTFEAAAEVVAAAHGTPLSTQRWTNAMLRASEAPGFHVVPYLGYDGHEPVAYGMSTYDPIRRMLLLGGAATLSTHRGRGLYSLLVLRRLADAHRAGMRAAVVQARRTTSAPILAQHGFRELMPIQGYVWRPPET